MGLTIVRKRLWVPDLKGVLEFFEREPGGDLWRKVLEAENIVLNGFYNDLLAEMANGVTLALQVNGLALGFGNAPAPARTDTGLWCEWTGNNISSVAANASGVSSIACSPIAVALVSGNTFTINGVSYTVAAAGAAVGATTIPVTAATGVAYTANQFPIVLTAPANPTVPQRMGVTLTTTTTTDPPQVAFSFYLPASANSASCQFSEAGLLYNSSSLTAGGAAHWASHVAFSYLKNTNTDLRIDYTLQRSAT